MVIFKITDAQGNTVAGLDGITADHSTFIGSRIAWARTASSLAEGESMVGEATMRGQASEVYHCQRLSNAPASIAR
jgi:hypothetical protein